jgi:hypothetical protein
VTDGWAFLVARGRRQGYRTRLVPGVLKDLGMPGLVEDSAGAQGEPGIGTVVRHVATPRGQVAIVYRTHRIRPGDLADSGAAFDEHGRPLDVIYGFVCLAPVTHTPEDADLDSAYRQALESYRRFLADESGFVTETSLAFPLRSTIAPAPAERPATVPPRPVPPRIAVVVGAAAVVTAVVVALLSLVVRGTDRPELDLTGTWTGRVEPARPGGPVPRRVAVTLTCTRKGCTGTIDELGSTCTHPLVVDRVDRDELRATVTRALSTQDNDCLPDGTVSMRRAGDTAQLDWYTRQPGEPLLRAPRLTTQR